MYRQYIGKRVWELENTYGVSTIDTDIDNPLEVLLSRYESTNPSREFVRDRLSKVNERDI